MSIKGRDVRKLMKQSGANFVNDFRGLLGLREKKRTFQNGSQFELTESAQISPDEFNISELADEFLGQSFTNALNNPKTADGGVAELREAIAAQGASALQDINAFSATVGGLIERKIMEGYGQVAPISDKLFRAETALAQEGQKHYCETNLSGPLRPTHEGQELPNVAPQPRWVWRPPTVKYGGNVALTREAMIAGGATGLTFQEATALGYANSYFWEYMGAVVFQGLNVPAGKESCGFQDGFDGRNYSYKTASPDAAGTNATYQTVAGTGANAKYNYVNQGSQAIVDFTSIQAIAAKMALYTEYETGRRIPFEKVAQIVVAPAKRMSAEVVAHATQVLPFSPGTSTSAVLGGGTFAMNPVTGLEVLSSPIFNKALVDSGISQVNADAYSVATSGRKGMVKAMMWPFGVQMASPLGYEMLARETVACWVGSARGIMFVEEPRYYFQATN